MRSIAKKLASALLALALVCALATIPAQAATQKFVVLGDSISAGEGASDKETKAYAWLLAADKGFALEPLAVGGHKSSDLLAILANNARAVQAIRDADIIDLSIGGNDLLASNVITLVLRLLILKDASAVEPYIESFAENFALIVEQIRALNPDALFIVQTLYNAMEGVPLVADAYEVAVAKLNQVYYDYLEAHEDAYVIADVHGAFKWRDGLVFRDRVHPSDDGHAMIARVLTAVIDGAAPVEAAADSRPGFFKQIGLFFRAAYDYLSYWLTVYTPWELLKKAFSFIV